MSEMDANDYLYPHHSPAIAKSLIETAQALVNPRGKGIYATDETINAIETTRRYRGYRWQTIYQRREAGA